MDAQSRGDESTALLALATACAAQAASDHDAGLRHEPLPHRLIEENMWRAIRHGLDGKLIDFETEEEVSARAAVERLLEWTEPARTERKLDAHLDGLARALDAGNGAQRQWRRHEAGEPLRDIFAASVEEACATYAELSTEICAKAGARPKEVVS